VDFAWITGYRLDFSWILVGFWVDFHWILAGFNTGYLSRETQLDITLTRGEIMLPEIMKSPDLKGLDHEVKSMANRWIFGGF